MTINTLKNLLLELVKIDSSTKGGANQTIDYCYNWLNEQGITNISRLENNGYKMLVCNIGKGEKTLILNGHVDVVSGKLEQFNPFEKNGKLYGRGTADMKAGVAAVMCAVAELSKKELNCAIQLQLVSDEEIGGKNCAAYLTESGYVGDFVICPEPTQLGIGLQAKGVLQIDITLTGKSAHASRPWEGENAIVRALHLYDHLLKLTFAQGSTDFFQKPSINLSKIRGGDVYNKVPDSCVLSMDIRFLPTQTKDEILEQIKSITNCDIDINLYGDPVMNTVNDPYIQKLLPIIKQKAFIEDVQVFGQHGFADTRYFSRFGIPAIEFGPSGNHWHGNDEYVVLDSVETYKEVIFQFGVGFGG